MPDEQKAFVDRNICIGCSVCSNECPDVFTVTEDPANGNSHKSFPNDSVEQKPIEVKVQKAIDMCPVQCISWKPIQIKA
ncbi:TPA: ferredoxin [archaeon]|nr:ferredoxin [Candidatus Naiadarchaeales archaeon SRR2090159.bin1288]